MRHARKGIFRSAFIVCTVLATAATSVGTAEATSRISVSQPSSQSLGGQFQAAYDSAAGHQLRNQLADIVTDPAFPAIATSLLKAAGPSGTNSLTNFQVQMLRAVQSEAGHSALVAALLTGKPLTQAQRLELLGLRDEFSNAAVQAYNRAGQQLKNSAQLPSVISAAVTSDSQVFSTLTPPSSVPQGGSADVDTAIDEVAAWRTSPAFATFDNELASALADPGLISLVRQQNALTVAGFLTPQQLAALSTTSLPHLDARTLPVTPLTPIQNDEFNLAALTFTLFGAVAAFALLTPPGLLVAGTIVLAFGILAWAAAVVPIANDLAVHLDCDNDGDIWDPADGTPSDPCPGV